MAFRSRKDLWGITVIGCSLGIIGLLALASIGLRDDRSFDPATLCPTDQDYSRTILVVDKTDPLSSAQKHFVERYVEDLKDSLPRFAKLSIYILDEINYMAPRPEFEMCKPDTGETANELYQNPRLIRQRFERFFGEPLKEAMGRLTKVSSARRSPIFEMLQAISISKDVTRAGGSRKLIIVSDMLQNTAEYSHFLRRPDYRRYAVSQYARAVAADLRGVKVEVIYLWRPAYERFQGPLHIRFWEEYFEDHGAFLGGMERVR
jgi:hypothetical protein